MRILIQTFLFKTSNFNIFWRQFFVDFCGLKKKNSRMKTLFKESNFRKLVGESYSVNFAREVFQVKKGYVYYWIKKKETLYFIQKLKVEEEVINLQNLKLLK